MGGSDQYDFFWELKRILEFITLSKDKRILPTKSSGRLQRGKGGTREIGGGGKGKSVSEGRRIKQTSRKKGVTRLSSERQQHSLRE